LIWGNDWHIFKPEKPKPQDEEYPLHVLIKQVSFFGPWPLKYQEIVDEETLQNCTIVQEYINENSLRKPFMMLQDPEIDVEDKRFVLRLMMLDPRDRPTAAELLQDNWLQQ
jgi:serine/threonine protein kinase